MKKIITRLVAFTILSSFIISPVSAALISEPQPVSAATTPGEEKINEALKEFKGLSKKERKEKLKEVKKAVKQLKAEKKSGKLADGDTDTALLVILAILIPPLAVYLHQNEINSKFWISLVLTLIFWIPGVIYSLLVVLDAI
jgi:uncharacterized membrane protein YqaE (UPF0057 family)